MDTRDSSQSTAGLAIAVPVLMVVAVVVIILVWRATGPLIAFLVFAGLCSAGLAGAAAVRRRQRGV